MENMKEAGCHTIIFGLETANNDVLEGYGKSVPKEASEDVLLACSKLGIRTLGTFILGLPGEDEDAVRRTIQWARELPLDFATFNVATPRMGTALRRLAISQGWSDPERLDLDSSVGEPAVATEKLSAVRLSELRTEAIRAFYGRPSYLARRIAQARSWHDLHSLATDSAATVQGLFRR